MTAILASRPPIMIEATAAVRAPATRVYVIIADYRTGHPRILPPKYFTDLVVEAGGVGEGTVIEFGIKAFGRVERSRARITEPEPGRVLVETVEDRGIVTTFRVDGEGADASRVTITTMMPARAGVAGTLERFFIRSFLAKVYRDELALLDRVATS